MLKYSKITVCSHTRACVEHNTRKSPIKCIKRQDMLRYVRAVSYYAQSCISTKSRPGPDYSYPFNVCGGLNKQGG